MRKDKPRAATSLPGSEGRGRLLPSYASQGKHQEVFLLAVPPGRQSGRPRCRGATRQTRAESVANGQQPSYGVELEPVLCTESEPSTDQLRRPVVKVGVAHRRRGDLRSLNQEARESRPTMSTWTTSGYNPWRSKLRRKVLTLRRQLFEDETS